MKKLKNIIILLGLIINCSIYAADYTYEEIKELKDSNLITQEVYDILLAEIGEGEYQDENIFTLSIDGERVNKNYKVVSIGGDKYLPILNFLEILSIKNYVNEENLLKFELGEILKPIEIDKVKEKITFNDKIIEANFNEVVKYLNDEIYLREDIFKDLLLTDLNIDENNSKIAMNLNFNSPRMMEKLREKAEIELEREKLKNENELVYTNERKLFELGNLRVNAYGEYEKDGISDKSDTKYVGEFEYQGSFLYGDLTTGYNTYTNEIDDTIINYKDILVKDHEFKVGSYNAGNGAREWGLTLNKNRGYFQNDKIYIIEYDVPIGSKVELLYYGIPIEIQDAYNGKVRFENPQIKEDRVYNLRITSPDGKIEIVEIKTSPIYNIQNKGEFEYNLELREDQISNKIRGFAEVFYGVTDNLTLGTKYDRKIEELNNKYKYIDTGRLELTYNDYIKSKYPFVFRIGTDRNLTSEKDSLNRDYSDKYKNDILFQIDINNTRITAENYSYGEYYSQKSESKFQLDYDVTDRLRLSYQYLDEIYRREEKDKQTNIGSIYYDYTLGNLLFSNSLGISDNKENNYIGFNLYLNSYFSNTMSLENTWSGEDMEYEGKLNIYNSRLFSNLDYNISLSYSEREKERLTFEFEMDLYNIFTFGANFGNKGSRKYKAGIDTVVDLRSIKELKDIKPINSIDSTNVKAIAFIDENGNNKYEENEELVENVEIKVAGESKNTDKNGEVYFYGVQNNAKIEVGTMIRRPSYTMGDTNIYVYGTGTGSVVAYIPIKPMMTLQGLLELDKGLNLSESERKDLYDNIVIQVKDKNGKIIESTLAEENGEFIISGLFTDKYLLEVEYIGTKFKIKGMKENITIAYNKNSIQDIKLAMFGNKIALNRSKNGGENGL